MQFPEILDQRLKSLAERSQQRSLSPRHGVDFSSNDYLGFAQDPALHAAFLARLGGIPEMGSTGSRLLRGNSPTLVACEEKLARFSSRESAFLLPSGYQANVALLSGILTAEDLVFSDSLNHASIVDGIRLCQAGKMIYPHRDTQALRLLLEESSKRGSGLRLIVTESLFSMDGDIAPLQELAALAEEFSASLIVDEAHATGLWGSGLVEKLGLAERVLATVHTGGKALGASGAWVAGSSRLKDYLVNFARPVIFSTAPPPALAELLSASVDHWKGVGAARAAELLSRARELKLLLPVSDSAEGPILPVILGTNERALRVAKRLQEQGLDARAIRPPTVPAGTARLRLTLHWQNTASETTQLASALQSILDAEDQESGAW